LPEDVTKAIFDAMKKEQEKRANNYREEGKARAEDIIAQAKTKESHVMATAQRKVDEIEGRGRREVGQIYKQFEEYPELRIFLDKLKALEEILRRRTTLYLDTDFVPVDLFQEDSRLQSGRGIMLDLGDEPATAPEASGQ
jgi:regulator of protease activity HflC (stomatin/prohibitin superfamily)